MNRHEQLVVTTSEMDRAGWAYQIAGEDLIQLVTPRHYGDGDSVEILVHVDGAKLVASDAGDIATRLESAGVNLDAPRTATALRGVLRSYGLTIEQGRVMCSGAVADAPFLLTTMADGLTSLDALRFLAPAPLQPLFKDELVTFLRGEFPVVHERPEVRGQSGASYRLTAAVGTAERTVYMQAASGSTSKARNQAVEHAYFNFSDIDGVIPIDRKLVVIGGDPRQWPIERIQVLSTVAFVGSWVARDRFVRMVGGEIPKNRIMVDDYEPLLA